MKVEKNKILIIGAGMAGLTLARQLTLAHPTISILIIDKRKNLAPKTIHKIGESTVELGAIYLRNKLQLAHYLDKNQLPKHGVRFIHHSSDKHKIENRIEIGSVAKLQFKTNHLDRGVFENDMVTVLEQSNVKFQFESSIQVINWGEEMHEVMYQHKKTSKSVQVRWLIDCSGRFGLLKKKLNLEKHMYYAANAAWFRLDKEVDINTWSDDSNWKSKATPIARKLSTVHFMGKGYWVWVIPLINQATSVGIVADPHYHKVEEFNTHSKALHWLSNHETQLFKEISSLSPLDFKIINHYSHDVKKHFSKDRWCISGEAGAFVDPLYSTGTDFIAMTNSWITKLIKLDLNGSDFSETARDFNNLYQNLILGWTSLYKDQYHIYEKPQVLHFKVLWDWGSYWAITCLLFKNDAIVDTNIIKDLNSGDNPSFLKRYGLLITKMQALFSQWAEMDSGIYEPCTSSVFENSQLLNFQLDLLKDLSLAETMKKIRQNLFQLELMASELYRISIGKRLDKVITLAIDPYHTDFLDSMHDLKEKSQSSNALMQDEKWQVELSKHLFCKL